MARQVDGVMSGYDALAAPTSINTATPIDEEFRSRSMTSSGPGDLMGAVETVADCPPSPCPVGLTPMACPPEYSLCQEPTMKTCASPSPASSRPAPIGTPDIPGNRLNNAGPIADL